jgi:hypothetical protein
MTIGVLMCCLPRIMVADMQNLVHTWHRNQVEGVDSEDKGKVFHYFVKGAWSGCKVTLNEHTISFASSVISMVI